MNIWFKFFFLVFFVLQSTACVESGFRESTGQFLDSSAVSFKVKARLLDILGVSALPIKVRTFKGDVQLSGFVDSDAIKQRAGVISSGTTGVRQVRNDLIVK